jgi:hypothetical protein
MLHAPPGLQREPGSVMSRHTINKLLGGLAKSAQKTFFLFFLLFFFGQSPSPDGGITKLAILSFRLPLYSPGKDCQTKNAFFLASSGNPSTFPFSDQDDMDRVHPKKNKNNVDIFF